FYKLLLATSPTDKSVSSQIRGIGRELELLEDSLVKKKTQEQQAEAKSYLSKFNVQFNTLQEQIRNSSVNDEKIKLNQRIAKYIEDIDDKVGLANQGDPILALIKLDLKVLQESAKTLLRQLNTEIGQQTAKNIAAEELKSLKSLTEPSKEEDTLLGQLNHFIAGGDALMDEDTKIRDYIEEISIRIENTSDFTVKTELEKVRNEAQKKLDEKSTFAEYVFKPMPDNKPELSERVTYFSKKDGDVFCQGLGLDGNPYEEKVLTDSQSSLKLDARLKFSNFQRDVLNELAAKGLVLYSVQQDWKFILENLCLALNLVKHSITDPKGSFHQELAKVGIFYENSEPENGKYVLKLSEAENFKTYKEYICDVDSQIAAAFDKKAAEARQTKLKKLHAKQFFFSPDSPTLLSTDKSGIFWGALKNVQTFHTLQPSWPKFSVEQSKLIEDDIKRVEEDLDGEDRAKLEKVRMDIEEAGKQQQVLFKAYEQQKKRVQELKVSDDILRQEDEILNKYEDSHEELADERGAVISKITSISEEKQQKIVKLGRLLEDVNDQNCKLNDVTQTISHEKATRYRIQKAIDTLISKHERFAVKPISLWIRISRSSRSIQLAKELSSIKNDLMNSSVKISEIRSKLVIALDSFKSNSNKNDDLVEFEEDLKLELVPECSSDAMYSLHQKQVGISFDQDTIISKILPVLNLEITNCHNELGALIARKSELEKEIRDLQSKVKAIRARRAEELVEKNNLQQVEKLKENSQQGQLIDAPNLKWLRILSEKNALPYNAHETVLTSSMDEKVEISREASLPIREETIHTPFEPRQDKEIVSENAVWDILTDLSPDQLTPIAELTKEETISGDSKKIKNRAKWAKIADPIIDPNTGMAPRYDHEANRHMGEIRKKHLEAVLEEAGSKGLKQFKPAPGDLEPDKPKAALLLSPVSGARIENRKKRADLRRKELLNQKTLPDSVKASGCRDSIFSHNDNKPKEANEALSLLDKVSLNLSSNLITHSH
ncbi:MAG: hypothetical protein K0R48_909, partial [Gammaproteobacteria bacterium]|nr:hypothetical protein [Gammaproteobacteria bacterium]